MDATINNTLKDIELQFGVQILYACETGSRAWGFPSPDSDYDVRMIYKHNLDWYLSIEDKKDTIEFMSADGELDITGWDIKKCAKLMWKSNGALLERVQSPIVYRDEYGAGELIKKYTFQCYSPIATMHHYLGMAKNSFADIQGIPHIKLKKLFYALRATLACKWIQMRDTPPPIMFTEMLAVLPIDRKIKTHILDLIELKSEKPESYIHPAENSLNELIAFEISSAESMFNTLPGRTIKDVQLDDLFRKIVKSNGNYH